MQITYKTTAPALLLGSPLILLLINDWLHLNGLNTFILVLIGGLMGAALNYFHYGFSSSFRSLINENKTAGMRAIIWMLGLAIFLFAPLLAMEQWQQQSFNGFIRTLSLSIPIGAFLFGIGMQIGCGCTSGTLNRVGQLQPLSFTTLFFMVVGGTLAAYTYTDWHNLASIEPFAFQRQFGWVMGLLIQLLILLTLYLLLKRIEHKRHGQIEALAGKKDKIPQFHPFLLAGLGLAFLNATLLFASGQPWSISSIFPYWGSRLIDLFNLPLDWSFWDYSMENMTRMNQGIFENQVSLTTMGVILGALMVSAFHPRSKVPISSRAVMGSIIGGIIMGFGAVMASGCNIGAFFSGIASGSGHGWVWFIFALFGNMVGLHFRKYLT
ncbi:YeeE/YedE thiosulfate transporter family protein [Thiomicrorhabdus sp.]|uniref:YeeE/YedE thiosulfate transporter family protein n=1 Tax=Thiomicrorhabdus sp. TaxID=2039724 RepID=UPI00356B540A